MNFKTGIAKRGTLVGVASGNPNLTGVKIVAGGGVSHSSESCDRASLKTPTRRSYKDRNKQSLELLRPILEP